MIKVLKGGQDPCYPNRYEFITAAVSDTRLMGVVALHAAFMDRSNNDESFHQFYYFDYEELGLEHMTLLRSDDQAEILSAINTAFAGLGAKLVELNERETLSFIQWMVEDTRKKGEPLPDELEEIRFIIEGERIKLSKEERIAFNEKCCVTVKSDYGAVNYYLMRCFGKDSEGVDMLLSKGSKAQDPSPESHSTFLRNKIELISGVDKANKIYRCESLIEQDNETRHHVVISELTVRDRKITDGKKLYDIPISVYEAGLLLNREEYVTVYELKPDADESRFAIAFAATTIGMTHNDHPVGQMFIDFMPDNSHAEKKTFFLNDDVRSLFFVSQRGQIVVAAYTMNGIMEAELRIATGPLGKCLDTTNRYKFAASIMYDFAESGFDDFNDYLGSIE